MALEIFRLVGSVFVDTDKAEKSLKKTESGAEKLGKALVTGAKNVGKFAVGVATTAAAAGAGIVALTESTREYRTEQGKLQTAFETNGFAAETARKTYESLNGVLGDSGQAVEAANHLAKLTNNEEELATWTKICTGVYATFGDSLPIEGLTEAANETAKTGALTGSLADALNWAGVNEDKFQAQLDKCTNEQQRQALITKTLNGLYTEAADHYRETNAEVIAANEAQDKLTKTLANVSAVIEPVITQGKLLLAQVLTKASPYIEQLAAVVIPWLVSVISALVDGVDAAIRTAQDFLAWLRQMGDYAGDTLQPILDDLAGAFDWVKQKLDPFISSVEEWITSGEAAEEVTDAVKGAVEFLANAYADLSGIVQAVVQGIQVANAWMLDHQTLTGLVAIGIGTVTTAITAYNIARAIKNAGGIIELAQLAALQVGIWGLTAAEIAQTAATTVATAATTAFGAVLAFITSPVTLVVLAIGALIGIIYLLIQNWDAVSAAAVNCWLWVQETWAGVAEWFNTTVLQPVQNFFTQTGETISTAFSTAWAAVRSVWLAVPGFFSGIWLDIQTTFSHVTEWFRTTFNRAWTAVKNVFSTGGKIFDGIKEGIAGVFISVVNSIIRGINTVISIPFNAINSTLNTLRGVSIMKMQPFGWISTFSVPQIPLLEQGGVLERGQVGLLEGNGAEAVVPLHNNKRWVQAVADDMDREISGTDDDRVLAVLLDILAAVEAITGVYLDKDKLVGYIARDMDRKLGQLQLAKGRT